MPATATKSKGSVVGRSNGGVREKRYNYFATPVVETILNLSDFGTWTNTAHTTGMYSNFGTSDIALYNGTTGVYIGKIVQPVKCTPKISIIDFLHGGGFIYGTTNTPPALCPEYVDRHVQTPDSIYLALNYTQSSIYYIYGSPMRAYNARNLQLMSPTFVPGILCGEGCVARGKATVLSESMYHYPGSVTNPLAHRGNNFYPHKIKVVLDVSMDDWYTGKYTDAPFYATGIYEIVDVEPTRNAETFLSASCLFPGNNIPDCYHYSCYLQNTQVMLPL